MTDGTQVLSKYNIYTVLIKKYIHIYEIIWAPAFYCDATARVAWQHQVTGDIAQERSKDKRSQYRKSIIVHSVREKKIISCVRNTKEALHYRNKKVRHAHQTQRLCLAQAPTFLEPFIRDVLDMHTTSLTDYNIPECRLIHHHNY